MHIAEKALVIILSVLCSVCCPVDAYYKTVQCYGTGDCLITASIGSNTDDTSKWASECHDGEALIGIMEFSSYTSIGSFWCKFMFPKKKSTNGIYPYYDFCNVRDLYIMKEFYCYDKLYPSDTYDTFVTGYVAIGSYLRTPSGTANFNGDAFKCCKLPYGYHLDYSRCMYKYTHDKFGEHYNEATMFLAKCDRDFLMTGLGKAENPWDGAAHYVWIQCCPLFYDPSYVPLPLTANITLHLALGGGTKPYPRKISGTSGYANKQVYSPKSRDDSQDDQISTADTEEETKVASM